MQAVPHDLVQGWIAYTSDRGGTFDIWLYRPQDDLNFQLTQELGAEFSVPYWSPDSRRIAFIGIGNVVHLLDTVTLAVARIDQLTSTTSAKLAGGYRSFSQASLMAGFFRIGGLPQPAAKVVASNRTFATDKKWHTPSNFPNRPKPALAQAAHQHIIGSPRFARRLIRRNLKKIYVKRGIKNNDAANQSIEGAGFFDT